jgi:hypothetical protein
MGFAAAQTDQDLTTHCKINGSGGAMRAQQVLIHLAQDLLGPVGRVGKIGIRRIVKWGG